MPARRVRPQQDDYAQSQPRRNVRPDRRTSADRSRHVVEDASSSASNAKRTGLACDRCRDRKIKCDSRAGKCGPCAENNVPCEVTDRNTGERYRRNQLEEYMIALSEEKERYRRLAEDNQRLRQQVESLGQQPVSHDASSPSEDSRDATKSSNIAAFDPQRVGRNYLGAAGHPQLSMLQGSQITLFGNSFDYDSFFKQPGEDQAFELSQKEYKDHVLAHMSARNPPFPPYQDAVTQTQIFFAGVGFFTPVLHRPVFYELLDRKYKQDHTLTVNETVIFHMTMSLVEYQLASRDKKRTVELAGLAKSRLLWSLTKVPELMHDDGLEAVQALALLCLAMRSLRRPGPAWSFCEQVLTRAMELGLHRSLSAWETQQHDPHKVEMRQRIFWTLMVVQVNISGNLGLAMRLRYEDIDIEIPECSPDSLPSEDDKDACSWTAAPYGIRLTQIMLQVYSTICTIRPSLLDHDRNASQLDKQLKSLEASLPPDFQHFNDRSHATMGSYVAGLYLRLGIYTTRLIICHPRHIRSAEFENSPVQMDILMNTSRKILNVAEEMKKSQSLDTTVYYTMPLIYAIFVALFVTSQQRTELAGLEGIEKDMQRWRAVLQDVDGLMGTGHAIRDTIHVITKKVLDKIRAKIENDTERAARGSLSDASTPLSAEQMLDMRYGSVTPHDFHPGQFRGTASSQSSGIHDMYPPQAPAYATRVAGLQPPQQLQPHGMMRDDNPYAEHNHGPPLQHHDVFPPDAMVQPFEGSYRGAQLWQNTLCMVDVGTLPIEPHQSHGMSGTAPYDLQPWSQYYVDSS